VTSDTPCILLLACNWPIAIGVNARAVKCCILNYKTVQKSPPLPYLELRGYNEKKVANYFAVTRLADWPYK